VEASDGSVVREVLAGDAERYRVLVDRYRERFGRYAVALVGDPDLAEDAVQEAFVKAFHGLATCRDPDRFGSWFFRILTNQCHDARARVRPMEDVARLQLRARDRTDAAVDRTELADLIEEGLAMLTPEQREAFVLKHVEGRTYEQIAGLTGAGIDALKMRVHRARDTLRNVLGERL
jgi:RNA polymerase sigma-70 factor (ECF subfamily)